VVRRPEPGPGTALAHQVAAVRGALEPLLGGAPHVVVGVSGGATLALALAAASPSVLGVVAHEPLLGSAAPDLAGRVRASRDALAAGELDTPGWFAGLVGARSWWALTDRQRVDAATAHRDLLAEITPFVDWEPSEGEVRALRRVAVRTTVGERRGPARLRAAAGAHRLLGAALDVVPGAGHLVQFDAPAAFASSVQRVLGTAA
jgi:pimeloyl-ACP methyl ester carboxylesterase